MNINEIPSIFSSDKKNEKSEYREFMERIKIEMGEFLKEAEHAEKIRFSGLKARKKSIQIRNLLKAFRFVSLKNEKELNVEKYKGTRPEKNCNTEIYKNVKIK